MTKESLLHQSNADINNPWLFEEEDSFGGLDNILFSPNIEEVYEKCCDQEAFNGCIETALFLFSQAGRLEESVIEITELLQSLDFNNKDIFKDREWGGGGTDRQKIQVFTDLAIDYWQRKLGLDFKSSVNDAITVGMEIVSSMERTRYHGTNTAALEGIKEKGLVRGEKGYEEDIEDILSIIKGIGESDQVFGYYKINSERKIFITGSPEIARNYAKRSPEWFSYFTHKGNKNQSYEDRDYQETKKYLEERISRWSTWEGGADDPGRTRRNLSVDEAEAIRGFFEKYWNSYGTGHPVVIQIEFDESSKWSSAQEIASWITIEREELGSDGQDSQEAVDYIRQKASTDEVRSAILSSMARNFSIVDDRIEDMDIEPNRFRYLNIPHYKEWVK